MESLKTMTIAMRLPIIISGLVFATILILSIVNYKLMEGLITDGAKTKLRILATIKAEKIIDTLNNWDDMITTQSVSSNVIVAAISMDSSVSYMGDASTTLRDTYITNNPHPLGERHELTQADTGGNYDQAHAAYHPSFAGLKKQFGFEDILILNYDGFVLYSVAKKDDFAQDITSGSSAESGLSHAFKRAKKLNGSGETVFVDFAPYAASNGAAAAFLARPLYDEFGTFLGVIAFQISADQLTAVSQKMKAAGSTAEAYLVGSDHLMRTDSFHSPENDVLVTRLDNDAVKRGLAGEADFHDGHALDGKKVMGYFVPIDFLGVRWVSLSEQETSELFVALSGAKNSELLVAGTILIFAIAMAYLTARSVVAPLLKVTNAVKSVADGDLETDVPCAERGDEIGDLARSAEVFLSNAIKSERMHEEQQEAAQKMARMAQESEQAAKREAELAHEKEIADQKSTEQRQEMMASLGQSFGQVVRAAIAGEFSGRVAESFDDVTLNELAGNINRLLGAVEHGVRSAGNILARVAEGDLTQDMTGDFEGVFNDLQANVNGMLVSLRTLVGDITASGGTVSSSSSELRQTADLLSRQAEQNAASVEETSATLEELSASIRTVSDNIKAASDNAQTARNTAEASQAIAVEAADSMDRIAQFSQEIASVVEVINDIAFQINLLALNAGVEAARAGEAGRGFSVVASEVRQLAQRAGEAAKEIDDVISRSSAVVVEGVTNVSSARTSLEEIAQSVVAISKGVDDVTNAITEQAAGIDDITGAMTRIDANTQKQAASFEEVTASSGVLAGEASELQRAISRFRVSDAGPSSHGFKNELHPHADEALAG